MNDGGGGGGGGGRSRRYEFGGENASTAGLTLGGILSIEQTPSDRIQVRTLLDLIRDDSTCGKESNKTWKLFKEKLWLKLVGSVCTTTVPILASQVRISTVSNSSCSTSTTRNGNGTNRVNSPPVTNTSSVPDTQSQTQIANVRIESRVEEREETPTEENRRSGGEGGERATGKMSLMSLLAVDGSGCTDDDDDEGEPVDGGGGRWKYSNCCVCMVRHRGAAFIPCGHTFCRLCSRELFVKRANCPLCNNVILQILDIF